MNTKLVKMAIKARESAYSPYSNFKVGAAVLAEDGSVYTGCNIENSSFGATVCAERVALFKAVSEGKTVIKAVAVAGGLTSVSYTTPCGICRQTLAEFCGGDTVVLIAENGDGAYSKTTLGALLPNAFGADSLEKE